MIRARAIFKPLFLVLILGALTAGETLAGDRFTENLRRDGLLAAERGDHERAEKLLRLACFGLLEEPAELAHCLVHLALAQAELGDGDALRRTHDRLVEIEERFGAYRRAPLEAGVRSRLVEALGRRLPPEIVDGSPIDGQSAAPAAREPKPRSSPPPSTPPPPAVPPPAAVASRAEPARLEIAFEVRESSGEATVLVGGERVLSRRFVSGPSPPTWTGSFAVGAVDLEVLLELDDGRRESHELAGNLAAGMTRHLLIIVPGADGSACDVKFE